MMQISTLSAQLEFGLELGDWYLDVTSVPYFQKLIDLSSQTDNRLRYSATTASIRSKFYIPYRLEQSNFLNNEHITTL